MVQGEKQSMMSLSSSNRTSDPSARKAGIEAVKKMEMNNNAWGGSSSSSSGNGAFSSKSSQQDTKKQYGSWGPMFQNKSTFAEMHWC